MVESNQYHEYIVNNRQKDQYRVHHYTKACNLEYMMQLETLFSGRCDSIQRFVTLFRRST